MPDDTRMIAIAIGVANSVPSKYLGGAINGARALEAWASGQGYETALVTDEEDHVTMSILREQIETLLAAPDKPELSRKPIHRIIIYFAGHGLIREIEEGLWLLSDWRAELRAVAVEVLKRRLTMYGARQICIISDACRSLPTDVDQADLVPDAVLGAGPKPVDMTVAIDKFIAAQDGAEAFMIPGDDPDKDRCLFSGVLVEGLWGLPGRQARPFSKLLPDKITSRSLGAYLQAEVPARASDYDLSLTPTISPTFPEGDDYYFSNDPPIDPPEFPPWPPKRKLVEQAARLALDWLPPDNFELGPPALKTGASIGIEFDTFDGPPGMPPTAPGLIQQLRQQALPDIGSNIYSGIAVSGAAAQRLWVPTDLNVQQLNPAESWSIKHADNNTVCWPVPVLIEFGDGRFAASTVLPNLFTSLVRDEYGVTGMLCRDLHAPRDIVTPTEEALAALDSGSLRADTATDLAVQLRKWKHADPVLGVISAYLYDAIGDIDSIRRMAAFYAQYGEAIPYDVALLGGLTGHRTASGFLVDVPEVQKREPRTNAEAGQSWTHCHMAAQKGLVAGFWPWMRQGWIFLDDPTDAGSPLVLSGLVGLRAGLMRSRFATLEKDAALTLAHICGLQARKINGTKDVQYDGR